MNPYPLALLNHFTLPLATVKLSFCLIPGGSAPSDAGRRPGTTKKIHRNEPSLWSPTSNQDLSKAYVRTTKCIVRGSLATCQLKIISGERLYVEDGRF